MVITLVIIGLVLFTCVLMYALVGSKSDYDRMLDDEEQMQWIKENCHPKVKKQKR